MCNYSARYRNITIGTGMELGSFISEVQRTNYSYGLPRLEISLELWT